MERFIELVKNLFDKFTGSEENITVKDYYASILIKNWLENSDDATNYDNLILSFLELVPEDVSVNTTLRNALAACIYYRRLNIQDNLKASDASRFAQAIRRQLTFWDPETES